MSTDKLKQCIINPVHWYSKNLDECPVCAEDNRIVKPESYTQCKNNPTHYYDVSLTECPYCEEIDREMIIEEELSEDVTMIERTIIKKDKMVQCLKNLTHWYSSKLPNCPYCINEAIEENLALHENIITDVFKNFIFKNKKWVLQKRIAWEKRGFPLNQLSYKDFEYKIRLEEELSSNFFSYYLFKFVDENTMIINYGNWNAGVSQYYPDIKGGSVYQHLIEINSIDRLFENILKATNLFKWLMDNYKPSQFSYT